MLVSQVIKTVYILVKTLQIFVQYKIITFTFIWKFDRFIYGYCE